MVKILVPTELLEMQPGGTQTWRLFGARGQWIAAGAACRIAQVCVIDA